MQIPSEIKTMVWVTLGIIVIFLIYFIVNEAFMPMESIKQTLHSIKQS